MKKSLIALAALAATGVVSAQSSVTISGRASMDVSTYSATGSTAGPNADLKSRTRVADTGSRIALSITEDLGGGKRAGVYCETGINIDSATANGQANTANANTSEWCSREGRLFLGMGDYELRLGRQNVWWTQGELNQLGSTFLGGDTGTGLISGGVGVFGVRLENMIKLAVTRGAFAGSEVYTGYMTANEATVAVTSPNGASNTATNQGDPKGTYMGFKVSFTQGPWVAMVDFQSSSDSQRVAASSTVAGSNSFDREAVKYGLAYKYAPGSLVSAQFWNKKRTDVTNASATFVSPFNVALNASTAGSAKDSGYMFVVRHDLGGGINVLGQYTKVSNLKANGVDQTGTGASSITFGGTYALSKRTHLYGTYHKITNQANAAYNTTGGNYASGTSANGADIKMLAVGMIHNF